MSRQSEGVYATPDGLCWHCGRVTVLDESAVPNPAGRRPDLCPTCRKPPRSPRADYHTGETLYDDGCTCQPLPEHRIAVALESVARQIKMLAWWERE